MNTQIFQLIKYDLNGHGRSQNITFMFNLTITYVLMDNFLSLFQFLIGYVIANGRFLSYCIYYLKSQLAHFLVSKSTLLQLELLT